MWLSTMLPAKACATNFSDTFMGYLPFTPMQTQTPSETPIRDSFVNLTLTFIGLTTLIAIVVVCLPMKDRSTFGRMFATDAKTSHCKEWTSSELMRGRHLVSYNNPMVRKTLDIPWRQ